MMKASRKCVLLAKALEDQNYFNHEALHFTLEPELEPASIACLAGRDAQMDFPKRQEVIQSDCNSCPTSPMPIFTRPPFQKKHTLT